MYDPHDADDRDAGGIKTASGELYDPVAWTAAIQIDLCGAFGGIHYGRNYRPAFALVEGCGKRAVGTRPNLHFELSSQIRRRPTIIRYTAICSPLDNSLRERRQSACFGGFHMGALQYYALCAETMTFSKRFMTGRPSFKTRLEAIMKLALEYLEDAIKFERLAALEENPEHKSALMGQAAAYRKLAEERAKKIGVSLPNKLD